MAADSLFCSCVRLPNLPCGIHACGLTAWSHETGSTTARNRTTRTAADFIVMAIYFESPSDSMLFDFRQVELRFRGCAVKSQIGAASILQQAYAPRRLTEQAAAADDVAKQTNQ